MSSINEFCVHPEEDVHLKEPNVDPGRLLCTACDCPISGKTYHCSACNSDLHPLCKASPNHLSSPLHPISDHPLTLLPRAPIHRQCTICNDVIKGVHYTCSPCHLDIHPQCSQLPLLLPHGPEDGHALVLQIEDDVIHDDCSDCREPCGKWAYRCFECQVSFHFWCLVTVDDNNEDPKTKPRGFFRPRPRYNDNEDDNGNGRSQRRRDIFGGIMVARSLAMSVLCDLFRD